LRTEIEERSDVTREPFYITTLTRFYRNKETTMKEGEEKATRKSKNSQGILLRRAQSLPNWWPNEFSQQQIGNQS
jgi:hypothetical protein